MTIRTIITTTATPPLLLPFDSVETTLSSDPLSLLPGAEPAFCPSIVALLVVSGAGAALNR